MYFSCISVKILREGVLTGKISAEQPLGLHSPVFLRIIIAVSF